jgi:hypothetical protein
MVNYNGTMFYDVPMTLFAAICETIAISMLIVGYILHMWQHVNGCQLLNYIMYLITLSHFHTSLTTLNMFVIIGWMNQV